MRSSIGPARRSTGWTAPPSSSSSKKRHAVQYFYEPFLEAFDPELRKDLGVWYTPTEVVRYMVARVDTVLREELDRPDGLASPDVFVLDPCCGTGAYLVEVLRRIGETLKEKGGDALLAEDLKRAAMERVFGFEILPAPFVVAHLQLGLLLQSLGAPLSEKRSERVGVYLTNALTGWEPPKGPKQHLIFPELEEERDAAERVKREAPILVVLGNPPYNAYAGVSPAEEEGLVEPYKEGLISEWGIKKFNLDELYVRFFRLAERRIAEKTGQGVICYISNFSYLVGPSFVVMRQRLLSGFDALWIDSLNGDSRETGKLTPDGQPDPSVFSTEQNAEGIRVGTTIITMTRRSQRAKQPRVRFREFWGASKREDLLASLAAKEFERKYKTLEPAPENRFALRPSNVGAAYRSWPSVVDLAGWEPLPGLLEKRKGALIDTDRAALEDRMRKYFDPRLPWDAACSQVRGLGRDAARFDAKHAREKAIAAGPFDPASIRPLVVMPLDVRWCYYTTVRPLWNEPRPKYGRQCWSGNGAIVCRRKAEANPEGMAFNYVSQLGADHLIHKDAYFIPLCVRPEPHSPADGPTPQGRLLPVEKPTAGIPIANISDPASAYLNRLGITAGREPREMAQSLWMHVLAVGYSIEYLSENKDGLRDNWPRVPLPNSKALLRESTTLGEQVAALLAPLTQVSGVTSGKTRPEMKVLALISTDKGGQMARDSGDLEITAGWSHEGKGGITMPAKGKLLQREYTMEERAAIEEGAKALGIASKEAFALLGPPTCDVYLNQTAYWRNIPLKVWEYRIGGYQVIKKWLSYREKKLLGRGLIIEEVKYVTEMARRIAALLLLGPALDANYSDVKSATFDWAGLAAQPAPAAKPRRSSS